MCEAPIQNPGTWSEDELALKNFLLDIQCLDALAPWTSKFNLFDILKISRTEIRHSNMLAWLLDPNEGHGLGDKVIRGILQYMVSDAKNGECDVFKMLLMDFRSFTIYREWRGIDILAISDQERFVLCIENKVGAGEHGDQLNRYRKIVEDTYPDYQAIFLFLTPDGEDPSDTEHWRTISYQNVLDVIISAKDHTELLPDVKLLIENYVETVRRHLVGDERLAQICNEIYAKHRKALDLIYEYRPDNASQVSDILKRWCKDKAETGLITFDPDKSSKTFVRFTTPTMTHILPEGPEAVSGWKSRSFYYYELVNRGDKIKLMLTLGSMNIPERQRTICERLIHILKPNDNKPNWVWKRIHVWNWQQIAEDDTEDEIRKYMDRYWEKVEAFEASLLKQLEKI